MEVYLRGNPTMTLLTGAPGLETLVYPTLVTPTQALATTVTDQEEAMLSLTLIISRLYMDHII